MGIWNVRNKITKNCAVYDCEYDHYDADTNTLTIFKCAF